MITDHGPAWLNIDYLCDDRLNVEHVIKTLVQVIRDLLDLHLLNHKILLNSVNPNIQSADIHFRIFRLFICIGKFGHQLFDLLLENFLSSKRLFLSNLNILLLLANFHKLDGGGGAVQVQAVGGADVAKVDEGDPVQVQVDDEDEVAKVVGPNEGKKDKGGDGRRDFDDQTRVVCLWRGGWHS